MRSRLCPLPFAACRERDCFCLPLGPDHGSKPASGPRIEAFQRRVVSHFPKEPSHLRAYWVGSRATRPARQRPVSTPICVAEPASPPAESFDPIRLGCQAFAPLRPALGSLTVSPVAAYLSHSAIVPGSLASAVSANLATRERSSRRSQHSLCWAPIIKIKDQSVTPLASSMLPGKSRSI